MCRLIGAVSSDVTEYAFCLQGAPRSLAALSPDHPHGWGLAVHDGQRGWSVHRNPACAREDERFSSAARSARGKLLIAHIRNRTVGATSVANTHPFQRGRWVFAHNGTITDLAFLDQSTSPARRREIEGETDSERFFAFLLTALDEAEGSAKPSERSQPDTAARAITGALGAAMKRPTFGAANFLLSNGETLFAFRFGRSLHVLDRRSAPLPEARGESPARRAAVLIASERITDEPWTEVPEGALLRVDGGAAPRWTRI